MYSHFDFFKQFYFALGFLVLIAVGGTVGFRLLEDYSWGESFYMTVITLSTVGFGEIRPLSPMGRLFTASLIIISFAIFAYVASAFTQFLVNGKYKVYFRERRKMKHLDKLENHVIICGYGRNGQQAAATLQSYNQKYVIIEMNEDTVEHLREDDIGNLHIAGDATDDNVLKEAGVERARALITSLPSDANNLFVVLTAREVNPALLIIARATKGSSESKLRMAGADNVIMPDKVGGSQMATLVMTPDLVEFLDHLHIAGPAEANLEEVVLDTTKKALGGMRIRDIDKDAKTGVRVIGMKLPEGDYEINPPANYELQPKMKMFVLGTKNQIVDFKKNLPR